MTTETSESVARLAAKGLDSPGYLSHAEIRSVCASALRQAESGEVTRNMLRDHNLSTPNPPEGGHVLAWRGQPIADMDREALLQTINQMGHILLNAHANHLQASEVWKALAPQADPQQVS